MEADGRRLVTEMISDSDGAVVDRVELTKPAGWGERFMERRAARTQQEAVLAVS